MLTADALGNGMTDFESYSLLVSAGALLVAAASAVGTIAAFRSARSAKQQAQHAATQADAAKVQARAAERQVDIMTKIMNIDHVGVAIGARRTAQETKDATAALIRAGRTPLGANPPVPTAWTNLEDLQKKLLDLPPVFPKTNVRALTMHYLGEVDRNKNAMASGDITSQGVQMLDMDADRLIAAMDVEIGRQIHMLEGNN